MELAVTLFALSIHRANGTCKLHALCAPGSPTLLAQSLTLTPVWSIMVRAFNAC
jgi:hypothetical protein